MTITQRILRFLDPETENLRMQFRAALDTVNAHTEDLARTVVMDGEKIAAMLREHHAQNTSRRIP
jgi:phage-related protein